MKLLESGRVCLPDYDKLAQDISKGLVLLLWCSISGELLSMIDHVGDVVVSRFCPNFECTYVPRLLKVQYLCRTTPVLNTYTSLGLSKNSFRHHAHQIYLVCMCNHGRFAPRRTVVPAQTTFKLSCNACVLQYTCAYGRYLAGRSDELLGADRDGAEDWVLMC